MIYQLLAGPIDTITTTVQFTYDLTELGHMLKAAKAAVAHQCEAHPGESFIEDPVVYRQYWAKLAMYNSLVEFIEAQIVNATDDTEAFKRGDQVLATIGDAPEPATFRRYTAAGLCVVKLATFPADSGGVIVIDPNLVTQS